MCGIIYHTDPRKHEEIEHRGVDHTTIEIKGKYLTHYWLPIQRHYEFGSHQPAALKGGWVLAYNGEIFGHTHEDDLEYLVDLFNSSATPVEFFNELARQDGFWSLILVHDSGKALAYTDPLGKKQLYVDEVGHLCSELTPLRTTIDFDYISEVGAFGYVMGSKTPWEGVTKLEHGAVYLSDPGKPFIRYFKPAQDTFALEPDLPHQLYNIMAESVRMRSAYSKVPIGIFISGGLDSSIIAHHAGELAEYYTIDNGVDNDFVKLMNLNYTKLEYGEYDISDIIKANEIPVDLGSMIPQYLLFQAAKESVIITGDGADELFGGYRRSAYYDSQGFDIPELMFYHLPRIDRMSMRFTKEARQPFLSNKLLGFAWQLPRKERTLKAILRDTYSGLIDDYIINRKKHPLKSPGVVTDEKENRYKLIKKWIELNS